MNILDNFVGNNKRLVGLIAASAVGYVAAKTLANAATLFKRFVLPGYNLIERYGKGSYAAISACTDGIGKGFALQLAKRGFNLVMFVRNVEKAQALVEEIKNTINDKIDVKIVQIDFLNISTPGVVEAAVKQVEDVDISLLVNNAGMTFIEKQSFEVFSEKDLLNIVNMNILSQVLLTSKLIPKLRSRGQKSGIINLSSVSTVIPMPGFHMYSGSKLFNDYFSKCIGEEYKGIIDVLSIKPGWVDTPMVSKVNHKQLCITPEECAGVALKLLGRFESTFGHFKHAIAAVVQKGMKNPINKKLRSLAIKQREAVKPEQTQS